VIVSSTETSKGHIGMLLSIQMVIIFVVIIINIRVCQQGFKRKWSWHAKHGT